jgi:RNA polymerase sigma-70 factor (ECF subfamily)
MVDTTDPLPPAAAQNYRRHGEVVDEVLLTSQDTQSYVVSLSAVNESAWVSHGRQSSAVMPLFSGLSRRGRLKFVPGIMPNPGLTMFDTEAFRLLIRQVRAGDQDAATALVQAFEPEVRRVIRLRLTDPRYRRVLDSADICQSVLANFFFRAAAGQFDIDSPKQLLKLLATMAKHKLLNQVERLNAQRRDARRQIVDDEALASVAAAEETPSRVIAAAELLQQAREAMTVEERRLYDWRAENRGWDEIAALVQSTPEAVRKRYERVMDRIAHALRVEESGRR